MAVALSKGAIKRLKDGGSDPEVMQVLELEKVIKDGKHSGSYMCKLTDGEDFVTARTTSQGEAARLMQEELIKNGTVVEISDYTVTNFNGEPKVFLTECVVKQDTPTQESASDDKENCGAVKMEVGTEFKTPGSTRATLGRTPGPTPPSAGIPASARKASQPIQALNPYNNSWTICAKVQAKGMKRTLPRGGASVFSAELTDDQGTSIEANFWRETADVWYDRLEDGQVYYFRGGKVKPANRAYSTVRNDYQIDFGAGTVIEESEDRDASSMQARLDYVSIDRLVHYIGKKMTVDVLGVVIKVEPLGSVKRKVSGEEVSRRDVTIVDQSSTSVQVTLWGTNAEEKGSDLDNQMYAQSRPIVSISHCRVTDFNGVSVSSLQRSVVDINPETPEASKLRLWFEAEGYKLPARSAGEGLGSALKGSGKGVAYSTFDQIVKEKDALPSPDAKAEYVDITATLATVSEKQSMYYTACPDNNRKVVEMGNGKWKCEYDGMVYDSMVRRYIMQATFSDFTGEAALSVFNDQAVDLLGMTADELAGVRDSSEQAYEATLKRYQWTDWHLRIQSRTQEYQGELRQRLSISRADRIGGSRDFSAESQRLVQALAAMQPPQPSSQ